jgi:hypothetical protein
MSSARRPASRPLRSHQTEPVISHLPDMQDWRFWAGPRAARTPTFDPQPVTRQRAVKFHSPDPIQKFAWLKPALVAMAVGMPLLIMGRTGLLRQMLTSRSMELGTPAAVEAARINPKPTQRDLFELRAAVELEPDQPDLLRAFARAATTEGSPAEARRCYDRLESLGVTSDADRSAHAQLLAKLHDFNGARAVLTKVTDVAKDWESTRLAWLAVHQESGDFKAAADTLAELAEAAQLTTRVALALAEGIARNPAQTETLARIEPLLLRCVAADMSSQRAGEVSDIGPRLAALPWVDSASRVQAAQVLRHLPGSPAEHRLAAVRLGYPNELAPSEERALRQAWIDELTWAGGMTAPQKDSVAIYLQSQHEHQLVADLIPAEEALSEASLYARRIESLMELGNWRDIGTLAAHRQAPAIPRYRMLTQSLAELHQPGLAMRVAQRLLNDALNEARKERSAAACFVIGSAASELGLQPDAGFAFASALDVSKDRHRTMDRIISAARHGGMELTTLIRSLEPSGGARDPAVQEQLIYMHLLAGKDVERMATLIAQHRAEQPENTYLRFLDSFAMHQRGMLTQAAKLLIPLPRHRWHQGEAAVLGGILASAGGIERSAQLFQRMGDTAIFAEERSLAEPWIARLKADGTLLSSTASVRFEHEN